MSTGTSRIVLIPVHVLPCSLAQTFHLAAVLGNEGKFAVDRIEDAIVQADEVDGKYLQFEGGLSITGKFTRH